MRMINKLKLLKGDPIECDGVGLVYPFTISDIKDMGGEKEFSQSISSLLIEKESVLQIDEDNSDELKDIENFDIVLLLCLQDIGFRERVVKTLEFLFKCDVVMNEDCFSIGGEGVLNRGNYSSFVEIVKVQNCLKTAEEAKQDEENPTSEKARELLRKREEMRKKVNEIKNKDQEGSNSPLELDDLVSILASNGNGIDIFNVWELSFYAFNDQFSRMKIFDDYQISVQSLLAGADPKEVEIKHWISKI